MCASVIRVGPHGLRLGACAGRLNAQKKIHWGKAITPLTEIKRVSNDPHKGSYTRDHFFISRFLKAPDAHGQTKERVVLAG